MSTNSSKKFTEGMEYMRQAEKCLKTSLFKWRPDYEGAAMDYANAATSFKNAKAQSNCKECLMKAADCHRQQHSYFSAAKSLEQAALVSKDMGDLLGAIELVERASRLFQEHGTPDTAALSLEKGAKMVESKYPDQAARFYEKAADVVLLEDRPKQSAEYLGKAARLMVKMRRYDEAADLVKREIELQEGGENRSAVGRLIVCLVLIHLTRGDLVAAQKAFDGCQGCIEQEEVSTIETLLEAFDQEDDELAARALNSPFLKHMDVEYAKLARNLGVPNTLNGLETSKRPERTSSVRSEALSLSYVSKTPLTGSVVDSTTCQLSGMNVDGTRPSDQNDERSREKESDKVDIPAAKVDTAADDEYAEGLC